MENIIKDDFTDQILNSIFNNYQVDPDSLSFIGGFENLVYEIKSDGLPIIIRFVHSSHRSFNQVLAEIEFIDYLYNNHANVSMVIHTKSGELVYKIDTITNYFTVAAFYKAPGTFVEKDDLTNEFMKMFGSSVGKLHALTKGYKPKYRRLHWYEENYKSLAEKNLPKDDHIIYDKFIDCINRISSYEQDEDSYGLIHTDLHFKNMYYDGDTLTFFDFDDASYKHFISDIAIIIYYMFWMSKQNSSEITSKVNVLMKPFMQGYNLENKLDSKWFLRINDYLKLREIILYIVICSADDEFKNNDRIIKRQKIAREKIINDAEFLVLSELNFYD